MSLGNNDNLQPNFRSRGNKRKNSQRDCSETRGKPKLETRRGVSKCPTKPSDKSESEPINFNNLDDLKRLIKLKEETKNDLIIKWASQESRFLRENVNSLHKQLSNAIQTVPAVTIYKHEGITTILRAIVLLYSANVYDTNKLKIPVSEFVHKEFNNFVCTKLDYLKLMCECCSKEIDCKLILSSRIILLNANKKAELYSYLRHSEYFNNKGNEMDDTNENKLYLEIDRNDILKKPQNCLDCIFYNKNSLKKNLSIKFKGENGVDEGGPTREFLQEMFNSLIEVLQDNFICNEKSNLLWFNALCSENKKALRMLGIIMGMALNHRVTLDLKLPGVFYKKLRDVKWELEDLIDVDKSIYTCLQSHLEYVDEDIYDAYNCTFQVSYYTQKKSAKMYDLKKDGGNKIVTQENKHEFVTLYSEFILNKSIYTQFKSVKEGFDLTTNKDALDAFLSVDDLQQIFSDEKELDVSELQKSVSCEGFDDENAKRVISDFWEIVRDFTKEQKKSLLKFVSGCERLPMGGLSSLNMTIQRHGPDSDLLPTSSTCYKILFLPEYCNKAKLKENLLISLRHATGFGLL